MRTKQRNFAIAIVGFIMSIAMVLGFISLTAKPVQAASADAPTLIMVSGAQTRYNTGDPGIKFTATITNYNDSYSYGMLILPEKAFTSLKDDNFIGRYHAYFAENNITNYADKACGVYGDAGEERISLALTHINDFGMGFVGVAYAKKDGEYIYAKVNMADNARSIAYVAQMALKYESNLDEEKINVLEEFTKGDFIISPEGYLNNSNLNNTGTENAADYAMKYIFNAAYETVSQITDVAYAGGSKVSFKFYIPAGTVTAAGDDGYGNPINTWWGIAWNTDKNKADIYHAAGVAANYVGHQSLALTTGTWVNVSFTLPDGGPYFLYFGSEVGAANGRWLLDGKNSYALIDDFTVGSTKETFTDANVDNSIFTLLNEAGCTTELMREVEHSFGSSVEVDYMLGFTGSAIGGAEKIAMITDSAYAGVKEITFKAAWTGDVTASRWGLSYTSNPSKFAYDDGKTPEEQTTWINCYTPRFGDMKKDAGVVYNYRLTVTGSEWVLYANDEEIHSGTYYDGNNYFYFMICPSVTGDSAAFYVDDFTITYAGGTVTDTFANCESSLFVESATKNDAHGSIGMCFAESIFVEEETEEPDEDACEYAAEFHIDYVETNGGFITKESYAGGTSVSFKVMIPQDSVVGGWWSVCWTTDSSNTDIYGHTTGNGIALDRTKGVWFDVSFTLPAGGSYYIYFSGAKGEWGNYGANGEGYVLIDDFTVGGETETFNKGLEASIFNCLSRTVAINENGYVVPVPVCGDYAVKVTVGSLKGGKAGFVTKDAYPAGSVITLRTYVATGTAPNWWKLAYTTNPSNVNMYNDPHISLSTTVDQWRDRTLTLPAEGGPYYIFVAGPTGEAGFGLIDNIVITTPDGTVYYDDFTQGADARLFNVNDATAISLSEEGEGYKGDFAAKVYAGSLKGGVAGFVTKDAYPAGSSVFLRGFVPSGDFAGWWSVAYTTDPTNVSMYDNKLGDLSTTRDQWRDRTFTLPADGGPYYILIVGATGEQATKHGFIDNVKITTPDGTVYYDDFSAGLEANLFNVNDHNAVTLSADGEGCDIVDYTEPVEPLIGDYAAKLTVNLMSSTASTPSFITKERYISDGTLVVTFDYCIVGNTKPAWWTISWTNDNTKASLYAFNEKNDYAGGKELPKVVSTDGWQTASVTIPAGEWYFYFAPEVGQWNDGYILIDNFQIGDIVTETFNETYNNTNSKDYGIFLDNRDSKPNAITLVEGLASFEPGEHAAQLDADKNAQEYVLLTTKDAYAGGSIISFKYYLTGTPNGGNWWGIAWNTDASKANIYHAAGIAENYMGHYSIDKVVGEWTTVEFALPAGGEYYLYFGHNVGGWNGYILIDDFTVNGELVEDFNGYLEDWAFNLGADYVSYADGYVSDEPANDDPNALVNLIANGNVVDFLERGGYASVSQAIVSDINNTGIPASMLLVEGGFNYTITGEKEFAIYLGNGQYVVVDNKYVALYNGTTLIKKAPIGKEENAFVLAITAGGKVVVGFDNSFIGIGELTSTIECVKLVALGGQGTVVFNNINIITYKCLVTGIPTYYSEEGIDFSAYNFDSESMVTDAGYKLLSEAGFTKSMGLQQGRGLSHDLHTTDIDPSSSAAQKLGCKCATAEEHVALLMAEVNSDAIKALDLAAKYGMKHYVINSNIANIERNPYNYQFLDLMAEYAKNGVTFEGKFYEGYLDHDALAGHYFADEPKNSELSELAKAYTAYKNAFGDIPVHANLYPNDSSSSNTGDYKTYVTNYMNNVAKQGVGYISYDHYPLEKDALFGTKTLTSTHLTNAQVVAELCRDNGLEFRGYVKASETGPQSGDSGSSKRKTDKVNDIYLQVYSLLCFGSREIIYYRVTAEGISDSSIGDAIIGKNSLKTGNVYEFVKRVNNEVHVFEDAYMNYNWKSVSVFGKSITQTSSLTNKGAVGYISAMTATNSATILVGNFEKAGSVHPIYQDKYGYMIMNYANPNTVKTSNVTITLKGENGITPTRALVYQDGVPTVIALNNNMQFTLSLETGEGAFVIPLV